MQRKEQLLSQLDHALKRKVQEKYMKTSRPLESEGQLQQPYPSELDKDKPSIQSHRTIHSGRSPANTQKQPGIHSRVQQASSNIRLSNAGISQSPGVKMGPMEIEDSAYQLAQQIKRLKGRNALLERELKQLKENLTQLERESKCLKRDEREYLSLKEENSSLLNELSFLRNKGVETGGLQEQLSKIMLHLNISPFNQRHPTAKLFTQALRSIDEGVLRLSEEKARMVAKMNSFDINALLLKQNSEISKKELEILRNENEQLQALIESNCCQIEELEAALEEQTASKGSLEAKLKETTRELDGLRREFRMTIEASKHTKPKRECSAKSIKEMPFEESLVSIVKTFSEKSCQTVQSSPTQIQKNQISSQDDISRLNNQIEILKSNNLESEVEKSKLLQKIGSLQSYIRGLEFQSQQIRADLNAFMPQLKAMEDENRKLKQEGLLKDQMIDRKEERVRQLGQDVDQISDQLSSAQLQLKKEVFQKQLLQTESQSIKAQVNSLTTRVKQLQSELVVRDEERTNQNTIQSEQIKREQLHLAQLQSAITQKEQEKQIMSHEWACKEAELMHKITQQQARLAICFKLQSGLSEWQSKLAKFKEAAKLKMEALEKNLNNTEKQLQIYKNRLQQSQETFKRFEQQSKHTIESYCRLEQDLGLAVKQIQKDEEQNAALMMRVDEMNKEMVRYKCEIQRLSFDNKNNLQLKEYYQQASSELQSQLQQLITQLTKVESEKNHLLESKTATENSLHHLQAKQTHMQINWEQQGREAEQLRNELHHLSQEYHLLSQQYTRFRDESSAVQRERLGQIALQNYDIERLVRESNEMKMRIDQLSSLRDSHLYKSSEANQQVAIVLEENRSLAIRIEQLNEQLRMKQASIQEDQYLNQLRNKQYCLLIRKILAGMQIEGLEECDRFEELLERGAQMTSNQDNHTLGKRFYIGTEISSSEEMTYGRLNENDQILQTQSKIKSAQQYMAQSPRSFKFMLSPLEESAKEKKVSRRISYFNHEADAHLRQSEKRNIKE